MNGNLPAVLRLVSLSRRFYMLMSVVLHLLQMPAATPSKPDALAAIQRGEDPKTVAERHGVAWPTFRVWMSRWRKKGAIQNMKAAATWEDIGSLTPWDKNPRHNAAAIEQVRKSIERFGFSSPIIARQQDRVIIAGHTRHQAALKMGLDKVPVRFLDLDPAQARALALADNKLGEVAEWDDGMLAEVLADLEAESVDLDGLGWSDEELAALLKDAEEDHTSGEEGELQELDKGPVHSRQGTIYQLGAHRLICGDCRDPDVVSALMAEDVVNVAFTSPPYASQRIYDESSGFKPITPDMYVDWFDAVQSSVRAHLAEDGSWFVNIKAHCDEGQRSLYVMDLVTTHVKRWAWRFVDELAWLRTGIPGHPMQMGRRFKNGFEPVFQFTRGQHKMRPDSVMHKSDSAFAYNEHDCSGAMLTENGRESLEVTVKSGMAYPSNVINARGQTEGAHTAAFPVSLPSFFIKAYSDPEDLIYDPFTGSGTTLIASAQNNRRFVGCEISPKYCDLIRRRWTAWSIKNDQDPGPGALEPISE